jgi:hypothetical protein
MSSDITPRENKNDELFINIVSDVTIAVPEIVSHDKPKRCSCCCCCGKSVKCIWSGALNCIEGICKGLSYFCIGCSKCALGCHDCLEKIDCDNA